MNLKNGILALAFTLLSAGSFAQTQFSIGLKGGLNFANLDVTNVSTTYENRTGYHLGAFTLIKLTKIGIQPELIFSQQGSKVQSPNFDSFESNFSYLNIPIILKLYTVAGINLQAGPQFGFLMNDPVIKDANGNEVNDAVKKSDFSVGLGAGWDLPFGLSIDARYNLGIKNVSDQSQYDVKNQVWQVSVGYKLFKFGK